MKNLVQKGLLFCCLIFCMSAFAGGGITHMLIAQETINKLPDPKLRNLLLDNLDAYLVGAYYPDSGYIGKATYGEISHWDPFINAFAGYLKATYERPGLENPRLTAFLFGCATHRVSDEIIHWTFYRAVKANDFPNDAKKAHEYGDVGIDLLINLDKNRWLSQPKTWWVPLKDLINVYQLMGVKVKQNDIVFGNQILRAAGPLERMMSPFAYPYLKWKMPWTAANYYHSPDGGVLMDEEEVGKYLMRLWATIETPTPKAKPCQSSQLLTSKNELQSLAENILLTGAMTIPVRYLPDGSFELEDPVITNKSKLDLLIKEYLQKFF